MTAQQMFDATFATCPLVAIVRGINPDECEEIGESLYEGGIRIIEVPLNSPDPLRSIERLSDRLGNRALIGAGTVLRPDQVLDVAKAGGRIIVSPSTNIEVIRTSVAAGLVSSPGYFTPSEAFTALDAGAHVLKLFPAEGSSPKVVKAQRAVFPPGVKLIVVGGVGPDTMAPWLEAGANGFGLGSGIYKPGQSPGETLAKARAFAAAVQAS